MSIGLVAAEVYSGRRVDEMPRWVMPNDSEAYWHIPRSASFHYGAYSVVFWCGQTRSVVLPEMCTDRCPDRLKCATCDGRAKGYVRDDGLIYKPRSPFDLPKRCPVTGLHVDACPACGGKPRYRLDAGGYRETRHAVGPDLAANLSPCPAHGWKDLYARDGVVLCAKWAGAKGRCDYRVDLRVA